MTDRISYYYLTPDCALRPSEAVDAGLLRVALAINEGSSLREVVERIFETVSERVPCDRVGVALLEGEDTLVSRVVVSRYPVLLGEGTKGRLKGSSLEPIVREQRIRVIHDLQAYARTHPSSSTTAKLVEEGMGSSLTLPLISKHKAVGVMFFTCREAGAYRSEHVAFLRMLATSLAIALERAEMTEALQRALRDLKTLDQLKTNFLSNLSHELRTPLSIMIGYLHTLDDEVAGKLGPDQHAMLAEALKASGRLNSLLNDLFDFTELVSGVIRIARIELDLAPLLRELAEEERRAVSDAGLELITEVPEDPLFVTGDPPRLARAIRELLANARKFTPSPGRITLRATRLPGDHGLPLVQIEVEDTGIGIPYEQQARIFDAFYQIEAGPSRSYGGSGLGLALARVIVTAHGGTISVQSQPGKGTCMRITLPSAKGLSEPPGPASPP